MPVYQFKIADGVTLEDPVGLDCESDTDASPPSQRANDDDGVFAR
jgi:hypothetical protein